jgi:hypothetical protein
MTVSPIFLKFVDDAARLVCDQLLIKDKEAPAEERVFFVHAGPDDTVDSAPDNVAKNLKMLLLRFHGQYVAQDAAELKNWKWLLKSSSHVTSSSFEGWRAVCVTLINHPNFYTY